MPNLPTNNDELSGASFYLINNTIKLLMNKNDTEILITIDVSVIRRVCWPIIFMVIII